MLPDRTTADCFQLFLEKQLCNAFFLKISSEYLKTSYKCRGKGADLLAYMFV